MTHSKTKSGNKRKKRKLVCLCCKHIYYARGYKKCPKCNRPHHAGGLYSALLRQNKKKLRKMKQLNKRKELNNSD